MRHVPHVRGLTNNLVKTSDRADWRRSPRAERFTGTWEAGGSVGGEKIIYTGNKYSELTEDTRIIHQNVQVFESHKQ